jgi:hypothetical protein
MYQYKYLPYKDHIQMKHRCSLSHSWSWALLEKPSQYFMEPEGSLPCSQEPSTGPYPEPDQSNPYHPIISLQVETQVRVHEQEFYS